MISFYLTLSLLHSTNVSYMCQGEEVVSILFILSLSHSTKVIYKRDNEDFQLRFSFKFDSTHEVFFAFAIPFGYRENQVGMWV